MYFTKLLQTGKQLILNQNHSQQKEKQTLKLPKSLAILLLLLISGISYTFATDYYQRQSGDWNNPGTWTTDGGFFATANTATYPQAGDNVHIINNGNTATITLTADAECANLYFEGSEPACIIAQGNYDLIVNSTWTTNWSSNVNITQGSGYLQINGGIPQLYTGKTINNFRVGSPAFYITSSFGPLTVTSNYDFNCYQSTIPAGINASSSAKVYATPCSPTLLATTLPAFSNTCTGSLSEPNSFMIKCLALNSTDITVAALNGYLYSTSANGTYSSTLSIPQSGGNSFKTIYVKFNPTTTDSYNGNIVIGGAGATNKNVAATGSGSNAVVPNVINPTAVSTSVTSAKLGATITVSSCTGSVNERGFYYSTTNGFANGTGTKVSEAGNFGTGTFSLDISGLSPATTYYYKAFATNTEGTSYSAQGTFSIISKTYYSRQSGNWNDPAVWSTAGCGQTTNTGTFPTAADDVILCQEHNITVNAPGLSCSNVNMTQYLSKIVLNYDFKITGNLLLNNHSYISAGDKNLTILGDFTNTGSPYNARIEYNSGNISIGGNINVAIGDGGSQPFVCSGNGWLIMTGTSKTITTNSNITIPNFIQTESGFAKAGPATMTISNIFDRNWGPEEPAGVIVSIPTNTIHIPTPYYKSNGDGNWSSNSTWLQSNNGGSSWFAATSIPSGTDALAIIQNSNTVTLDINTTVKVAVIQANSTLLVNPRKQLTVNNSLTNNGVLKLLSDATGTATLLTSETINGSGSYKMQQYLGSIRNWYISSPLDNAPAPVGYTYFKYIEPGNNTGFSAPATANWMSINAGTQLNPMTGYIAIPSSQPATIEFSGSNFNNGNKTIVASRSAGKYKEGFNLIGNPYPSYVNWSASTRTNLEPTIWYRTKNNAGNYVYDTFNGVGTNNNQNGAVTGYIPPMQSFWVRVSAAKASGSVTFANTMRSHEIGTNKLKAPSNTSNQKQILRLQVSNATNSDEALIVINEDASNSLDNYDAQKMTNGNSGIPEIYTSIDNEELTINALSYINDNDEISLGFRTGESNNFSLKASEISNFNENTHIILKDNLLNSETDLSSGEVYNFNSDATVATNRFSLIFRNNAITTNLSDNSNSKPAVVYQNAAGNIVVEVSNKIVGNGEITLYNTVGQKIAMYNVISSKTVIDSSNLKTGIYYINLTTEGKSSIIKVMIN